MVFNFVTDTVIRRNLVHHNNRNNNVHLLVVADGSRNTIEENELYDSTRHMIYITQRNGGAGSHSIGRNYCNGRPNAAGSCITVYPSSNNYIENNIAEGGAVLFEIQSEYGPQTSNNRFFANIALNSPAVFAQCRAQSLATLPKDLVFRDIVSVGSNNQNIGIYLKGTINAVVDKATLINGTADGLVSTVDSSCSSFGSNATTMVTNSISADNAGRGFAFVGVGSSSLSFVRAYNNSGGNYEVGGYANSNFSTSATNASLAGCPVFVPNSATALKGTGSGGADIGATVLYKSVKGVLDTSIRLWDPSTGKFNANLIGASVNDADLDTRTNSIRDIEKRLHPNCSSWSQAYGSSSVSVTRPSAPINLTVSR
jgi:hypothetical protein